MNAIQVLLLISLVVWVIVKAVGKSKGQTRCNDCGHIGELVPAKSVNDIGGAIKQKLVCSKCGSANVTEMKVIQAQIEEKQRADAAVLEKRREDEKSAQYVLETMPHCQECSSRVEHGTQFCTSCGSDDLVSHEDWLLSPVKEVRQKINIGREIAQFKALAKGMKHCPSCDSFNGEAKTFCPKCGNELVALSNDYLVKKYGSLYPDSVSSVSDLDELEKLRLQNQ